jgi:cell division ATP-binding protein FtsE
MIQFKDVFKEYPTGTKALKGVSFTLRDGEFAFLVGPSGSGKSTLIKLITGEISPTSGSILVNGYMMERIRMRKLPYVRRTLGVVFQDFRLIDKKTVYENVAFAMRVVGAPNREIRSRVPYVLGLVGLEDKAKMFPNELSGGEQQRVAIARAIAHKPKLVFADEPTGELDTNTALQVVKIFKELNQSQGVSIVMTTHDRGFMEIGDRVYALENGEIVDGN